MGTVNTKALTPLHEGQNPRAVFPSHKERGPRRYTYTIQDVARAASLSVHTVRSHKVDLTDFKAVCLWVASRQQDNLPKAKAPSLDCEVHETPPPPIAQAASSASVPTVLSDDYYVARAKAKLRAARGASQTSPEEAEPGGSLLREPSGGLPIDGPDLPP
jgi:hypothetical protein